ncbi:MAG: hypothetical protein ACRD4F_04240, partial [Candidatus Angelobacter sp.]
MQESGTAAILTRSPFAHGYRHGYEAGYHQGNMDINMVRPPKARLSQVKGVQLGYRHEFGSRRSFELGFQSGLKAGYRDGYAGRVFRVVSQLRFLASDLNSTFSTDDAENSYFNQGIEYGYLQGVNHASSGRNSVAPLDFHLVACATAPLSAQKDIAKNQIYCKGYRRGYVLGLGDSLT